MPLVAYRKGKQFEHQRYVATGGRSWGGWDGLEGSDGGGGQAEEHGEGVEALVGDPEIAGAVGEKAVGDAEVGVETVAAGAVDAGGGGDGGADGEGVVEPASSVTEPLTRLVNQTFWAASTASVPG